MIISIDPGVSNCGVSRLYLDENNVVIVKESINVKGSLKLRGEHGEIAEDFDERTGKVIRICDSIDEILNSFPEINMIILEAPFIHPGRPMAVVALLEVLNAIKYRLSIIKRIKNILIAPKLVKKLFYGNGKADKEKMQKALKHKVNKGFIILDETINIEELTEHQIDSIAVGYSYITHSKGVIHEEIN